MSLPADYLEFAELHGGKEQFIGEEYLSLWEPDELAALNESYEVEKSAPGLLVFASNGGGEAYGFDTRRPTWPVVMIPFIGMEWKVAIPVGNSFSDFLQRLQEPAP